LFICTSAKSLSRLAEATLGCCGAPSTETG
jgi:hypothetical protein